MNVKFAGNLQPVTDFIFQTYNTSDLISIIVLLLLFLIQMYTLLRFFFRTLFIKPAPENTVETPISVIVPVQGEEKQITETIDKLQSQQYSNFELIIVDAYSRERSFELHFDLNNRYKNVKYTGIEQNVRFSEKMNINLGLKAAKNEWVIFTDANAIERNPNWLKTLNNYINDEIDAIVAYSNIAASRKSFFFRLEKMCQYLQSISCILGGKTLICNQENVLMRKDIYFKNGGFRKYINKSYANLELILNEKLNKKRIKVATCDLAVKSAIDEYSDLSYLNLVKKEMQIRKNLKFTHRLELVFDEYSRILFLISGICISIFRPLYWEYILIIPTIYFLLLIIILGINQKRLSEQKIFLSSFVYILIRPFIVLLIRMTMIIKDRRNRWI